MLLNKQTVIDDDDNLNLTRVDKCTLRLFPRAEVDSNGGFESEDEGFDPSTLTF